MKKLFRFIPLYGITLIMIWFMISLDYINFGIHADGVIGTITFIFGSVTIISTIVSVFTHISELGNLQNSENDLLNSEEYLKEVKEHIKIITDNTTLDDNILAKSNVDHPIVSALDTLKLAQNKVRGSKDLINYWKSNIGARKAGPFEWVVDTYGERL